MERHMFKRRRVLAGVGLVAGAVGSWVVLPASAQQADVNPHCADVNADWSELRVDAGDNFAGGTFSNDDVEVTITVHSTDLGPTFDWDSDIGIDAVIVKGGPNVNVYTYDPPAESFGDEGLHAQVNPNNDKYYGLSHIDFCYDLGDTPPSTAPPTTAPPSTTSTTKPTTPTTKPTTPTTAPGGVSPAAPAKPVPGRPTFTG